MNRRWTSLVAVLTLATIAVTACGNGGSSAKNTGTASRILNVGVVWDPATLDPHVGTSAEYVTFSQIYEPLVYTKGATAEIIPWLAKSWTVSADGLTYTFKLRTDVKFHDGSVFDANAVKANFDRVLQLKKGPFWALGSLKGVTVVDPSTVQFQLASGGPPFLMSLLLVRFISPKALTDHAGSDNAQTWLTNNEDGTGPYQLQQFTRGDRVVLKAFKDYWQGWTKDQYGTVNLLVMPEANTQALQVQRGDIDVAFSIPKDSLDSLGKTPSLKVVLQPGGQELTLRMNVVAGPTADASVRKAMSYAFDYESFIKTMSGTYAPSHGPVPALYLGGQDTNFPYTYSVDKAKQLLGAAGYSESKKAVITIDILSGFQDQTAAATILKSGAEATGMATVNIRNNQWAALSRDLSGWIATKDAKTVHPVFELWTSARIPDPYAYLWYLYDSAAQSGDGRNWIAYSNGTMDSLIRQASEAKTPGDRAAAYKKAAQLAVDDATDVFAGIQNQSYVVSKHVGNFYSDPNWYPSIQLYALHYQ